MTNFVPTPSGAADIALGRDDGDCRFELVGDDLGFGWVDDEIVAEHARIRALAKDGLGAAAAGFHAERAHEPGAIRIGGFEESRKRDAAAGFGGVHAEDVLERLGPCAFTGAGAVATAVSTWSIVSTVVALFRWALAVFGVVVVAVRVVPVVGWRLVLAQLAWEVPGSWAIEGKDLLDVDGALGSWDVAVAVFRCFVECLHCDDLFEEVVSDEGKFPEDGVSAAGHEVLGADDAWEEAVPLFVYAFPVDDEFALVAQRLFQEDRPALDVELELLGRCWHRWCFGFKSLGFCSVQVDGVPRVEFDLFSCLLEFGLIAVGEGSWAEAAEEILPGPTRAKGELLEVLEERGHGFPSEEYLVLVG